MKLISWNVNGIRAVIKKGFLDYLEEENPDIIAIQETKGRKEQVEQKYLDKIENLGYIMHFNPAERAGYSGTAVFTKIMPISVFKGINITELDLSDLNSEVDEVIAENHEGRVMTLEYKDFYLVNVYTPNAKPKLERLEYRQEWDKVFKKYVKHLEKEKPVLICGDLNVAHKEIDLKNPKTNRRKNGFTDEERAGMTNYINSGFIDTFRHFYPEEEGAYTWWSYLGKARNRNAGWRIDYFLASKSFMENVKSAFIRNEVMGSDHCPVGIEID
ncbi:MAG: exodeoxyribonuclease III [Candidatus Gracilibacteria bacterium]|nr:exodeoxyribonuclease III [Candidatus Gracilibacteria bacterium]